MADDNTARRGYPYSRGNPDLGPRASDTDPLTELARLIGQTRPFDPAPRGNGRDHEWPGAHPPMPRAAALPLGADYRDDQYAHEPAYDDQQPQQGYEQNQYEPQTDYGQAHPQAPYYGDNGQLAVDDPYAPQQYEYDEPPPRRRSGLVTVIVVIGLGLLGAAGAYGYRSFTNGGVPATPPLIKADSGPNKVAPAQQGEGGTNKQIYDRVGSGAQTEKIVSREEQPVDVKPANARPAYVPAPSAAAPSVGAAANQMPQSWPNPPGATVQQPPPGGAQPDARKVRTVTIRPDQGSAQVPAAAPSPPAAAAVAPAPAPRAAPPADSATAAAQAPAPARPVAPAPRAHTNAPLSLTPQGASERMASAEPRSIAPSSAPAAGGGGGYVVQLSAQKSEGEASAAFRSAQARYPNLLGNRQLIVRRKEIAGKGTFYGAQVGPFASREDANQLCEGLKSAGGTCIVQRN